MAVGALEVVLSHSLQHTLLLMEISLLMVLMECRLVLVAGMLLCNYDREEKDLDFHVVCVYSSSPPHPNSSITVAVACSSVPHRFRVVGP